jgi:uncharacterized membrane protein
MSAQATRWMIRRNCSASPRQLAWAFGSVVAVSLCFGLAFAGAGAWLILPFVGLELLALAVAFFCYGRHATDFERIELCENCIEVERVDGTRHALRRLALPWVSIETTRPASAGGTRVFLVARGERIEVGRHLLDARRMALADELKQALRGAAAA